MPLKLRLPSGLAAAAHQADLLVFESHLHFRESLGQVRMATEHVGQKSAAGLESLFAPGAVHLGVAELVGQVLGEMGNGQMPLDLDGNVGNVQLAHRALHLWLRVIVLVFVIGAFPVLTLVGFQRLSRIRARF